MGYDFTRMQFATSCALEGIEQAQKRAARLTIDADADERKKQRKCRLCFNSGGMSVPGRNGCDGCGKVVTTTSGQPAKWCDACADQHGLCKVCGADRELREGRRK